MLMIRNNNQSFFFLNFLLLVIFTTSCSTMSTLLGGLRDSLTSEQNSAEIDELARFAVDDHNKKQNSLIQFVKVVKAQEQVVAGTLHHLTIEAVDGGIEAVDGGNKKLYDTKIWVKPWMNFKEVQEFKHADSGAPSLTSSDLGVKKDGHGPGFQVVPSHDPMVQDAANHAVKSIQQRSNSLFPYELSEILHAKAEVLEESAVFDILLKLKRGDKEEKMKVKVHKNNEGAFVLNHMEPDHST